MDIWDWVIRLENDLEEAGQEHASRIIEQVTTEILDLNIGKADALIPEAIALSRSLKNPWLEVFFRHWEMRNRIGNKSEGEAALADVVSLFEFAHRDETITCPQTVCVTQDLSIPVMRILMALVGWKSVKLFVMKPLNVLIQNGIVSIVYPVNMRMRY